MLANIDPTSSQHVGTVCADNQHQFEKTVELMSQEEAASCLIIAAIIDDDEKKRRGKTRNWIKRRGEQGFYLNIVQELRAEDTNTYKEMMRMSFETFMQLLHNIEPYISPSESFHDNKIVTAQERLVLTIRFLATGDFPFFELPIPNIRKSNFIYY